MARVTNLEELFSVNENGNRIFAEENRISMKDTKIEFLGKNNRIYFVCKEGESIQLEGSTITLKGDNNIIVIRASKFPTKIFCTLGHGCSVYIGKNFWSTNCLHIMANEMSNVYIGEWCLFARDIWIRTSDMHLIYNTKTKQRINYNKDVYIGEHVWVGQEVCLAKGAVVGSGSIVGTRSLCNSTKTIGVNSSYEGSPARLLHTDIMWRHKGSNQVLQQEVLDGTYDIWDTEKYIYDQEQMEQTYNKYESVMFKNPNMEEKIKYLLSIK